MAKQLQLRRGTTAQHATFTGAVGEVTIDTDKDVVVVHDGATAGGFPSQKELVSGNNIKTINGSSILTSGNLDLVTKVSSIEGLASLDGTTPTVIVTDLDRGGTFIWSSTGTANGGTVFAGSSGYWVRQYSGAVNVKWFGAKGDGVTDDTVAIQNTIDYASKLATSTQYPVELRGIEVYLSGSVYNISNTLKITTSGVSLIGEGQHSTIIKYVSGTLTTSDYLIDLGGYLQDAERMYSNRLEKFSLTHDVESTGINSPRGIRLSDVHSWVVKDIRVFGTHQGFYAENAWVGCLSNSFFLYNYRSVHFNAQVHNVSVRNVSFGKTLAAYSDGAISSHFSIRNCWGIEVVGCDFEFGDVAGLVTCIYLYNSCRGIDVSTNYFEANTGYAMYVRDESADNNAECSGITFKSNFVNQGGGKGIYVRHNNTASGALHNGILVEGNYVFIDQTVDFIQSNASGVITNSFYKGNYIRQALSECQRPENWNQYNVRSVTATDRCFTPSKIVNQKDLSIGVHSYDFLSYRAVPLQLTTTVSLQTRSAYLVSIVLETGAASHETGLYLVSMYSTSTQVYPLRALSQGTVSVVIVNNEYFVKYDKTGGFDTGVRITIIPINGR